MGIPPNLVAWLADMHEWATDPLAPIYLIRTKTHNIAIFPEDVTTRTDEQLLEFIGSA
jgi:hypothetical protein